MKYQLNVDLIILFKTPFYDSVQNYFWSAAALRYLVGYVYLECPPTCVCSLKMLGIFQVLSHASIHSSSSSENKLSWDWKVAEHRHTQVSIYEW